MMHKAIGCVLMLLGPGLLLAGCGGDGGDYWVTIVFPPNDTAWDRTTNLEVFSIKPGVGAGCAALYKGTAKPHDEEYEVEDSFAIDWPAQEIVRTLSVKGKGERLFFARGRDQEGNYFMKACEPVTTGASDSNGIKLQLVCTPSSCI